MTALRHNLLRLLLAVTLAGCAARAGADDDSNDPKAEPPSQASQRPPGPPRPENGPPGRERRRDDPRDAERREGGPRERGPREDRRDPFGHHQPGPGDQEWMRQNDPEMFKLLETDTNLDHQSRELGMESRRLPKDKQDELKKKLQGLVLEQFDARQQRRGLELKRLEAELKRIRESIEKREQSKQSIVERRVAELMGEEPQF